MGTYPSTIAPVRSIGSPQQAAAAVTTGATAVVVRVIASDRSSGSIALTR